MAIELTFLGGAGTVTGSRTLVRAGGSSILVDCGMFQGRGAEDRNWEELTFDPASLDAVLLTHAHVDHCGWLPRLVAKGFAGPVLCTPPTAELAGLMLLDSAHLQEEQAEWANRKGYSRHRPALPLYTVPEAEAAVRRLRTVPYGRSYAVTDGLSMRLTDAGHILGSAHIELTHAGRTIVFSGDIGHRGMSILRDPASPPGAEAVVCESTYGDRAHPPEGDRLTALATSLAPVFARGGVAIVPAFAVGRAQEVLYDLGTLFHAGRLPSVPVYVDSPLAVSATEVFRRHPECFDAEMRERLEKGEHPIDFAEVRLVRSRDESKLLNELHRSAVIVSASGMAEGGRVVHHLAHRLPNPKDAVLFVGYQAEGTRGRRLVDGAESVRIFGRDIEVRAQVSRLDGFSAHADADGIVAWLRGFRTPPGRVLLNHGEPGPSSAAAERIRRELSLPAEAVTHGQVVTLA